MSDGGKGSKARPLSVSQADYAARWDAIFGRDQAPEPKPAQQPTIAKAAQSVLQAWDCTVLPKANDGALQEAMEKMRWALEQSAQQPLTEEQIELLDCIPNVAGIQFGDVVRFARAIEAAHGITGEKK